MRPCHSILHRAAGNSLTTDTAELRRREEFQIRDVERRVVCSPPLSVACNYRIGTTEVTNSPYVESLKPKAAEQFLGSLQHRHGRRYPNPPAALADEFRKYYGPTMNAFEAAEKNGRAADLPKELEELFNRQNQCPRKDATSILATFLRDTVAL